MTGQCSSPVVVSTSHFFFIIVAVMDCIFLDVLRRCAKFETRQVTPLTGLAEVGSRH